MTGVMDRFSTFVLEPNVPDEALARAALLMTDTLGVAAGASIMEAGIIARETAIEMFQAAPENQVPLLFDGRPVSPAGAAFALATQIDNLDAHDGYNPVKGHIGCAAVPALFSFAADKPNLSGRDALAALAISYEVAARAGKALHATVSDYHTSGAWNALGVAALGCSLAGANADILRQAIGIAEYHGPRSQMMREIANPTMLHDGSGMGALVGVMAANMALRGFTGAPAVTVEDEAAEEHWATLGTEWTILDNYIKPYPVCRWAHAAIDGVRKLRMDHALSEHDVAGVTVRTFKEAACLFAGMPESSSQAQYSLPFACATMLLHGEVGVEHLTGDALADPKIAEIIRRIDVVEADNHNARFPQGRWSDVTIELTDGLAIHSGDIAARGGPDTPLGLDEVEQKFMTLCSGVMSSRRAATLWEAGNGLCDPGAKFAEFAALANAPLETDEGQLKRIA